jgi:predicted DNA-binding protein with PD1-like motif
VRARQIAGGATATYVAVLDPFEEAVSALSDWAARQQVSAAQVTAVGAFERATVGWFDRVAKDYRRILIDQQCEVLSLLGDIARGPAGDGFGAGQPQPHLHAVLGLHDGTTRGGHLLEGRVWPTLEVIIREAPAELRKTHRPDIGLALIDLDRSRPAPGWGRGTRAGSAGADW